MATPVQPPLTSIRTLARDRHHARARAEARGLEPEGPAHIVEILRADPAFQNLVAVYKRELREGVTK